MIRVYSYIILAYIAYVVYSGVGAVYDFFWHLEYKTHRFLLDAGDRANNAVDKHFSLVWWNAESPGEEIAAINDEKDLRARFPGVLRPFEDIEED